MRDCREKTRATAVRDCREKTVELQLCETVESRL